MTYEPQGEDQGDGIFRREFLGYTIDEDANSGWATVFDASGAEMGVFSDYLDAEKYVKNLADFAEEDRGRILYQYIKQDLEGMIQFAGSIPVPFKWDSDERRRLEAFRAIGIYIYGLDAWNAEWRAQGFATRQTVNGPGESYEGVSDRGRPPRISEDAKQWMAEHPDEVLPESYEGVKP